MQLPNDGRLKILNPRAGSSTLFEPKAEWFAAATDPV
jgi:hypothetical protein